MNCLHFEANGVDAVQCWISVAKEKGREIPEAGDAENQSGKWVQRVPRSLHARLTRRAKAYPIPNIKIATVISFKSLLIKENLTY